MSYGTIESAFQDQADAHSKAIVLVAAALSGRSSLWSKVDAVNNEDYENVVKGDILSQLDLALDTEGELFQGLFNAWSYAHEAHFACAGETDVDTALDTYRWRISQHLAEICPLEITRDNHIFPKEGMDLGNFEFDDGILLNGEFEDWTLDHDTYYNPDDWTVDENADQINRTTTKHRGTYSCGIYGDGSAATIEMHQEKTGLQPDRKYYLACQIKGHASIASGDLTIQFEGLEYTPGETEKIEMDSAALAAQTSFDQESFLVETPSEIPSDFKLVVKIENTLTSSTSILLDSMELYDLGAAYPIDLENDSGPGRLVAIVDGLTIGGSDWILSLSLDCADGETTKTKSLTITNGSIDGTEFQIAEETLRDSAAAGQKVVPISDASQALCEAGECVLLTAATYQEWGVIASIAGGSGTYTLTLEDNLRHSYTSSDKVQPLFIGLSTCETTTAGTAGDKVKFSVKHDRVLSW